ncbi:Hypothetical protein MVR_LOCUS401 [uncultured virus]|nr:Hypothetical protein MVR_LOCUS401 [uncultured virus]
MNVMSKLMMNWLSLAVVSFDNQRKDHDAVTELNDSIIVLSNHKLKQINKPKLAQVQSQSLNQLPMETKCKSK